MNTFGVLSKLFFASVVFSTPAMGQLIASGLGSGAGPDLSKYDTLAGADGTPAFTAGTPLADGRPGQYYYDIGAYAFTHHDYPFAINMYTVAASWAYKPAEYNLGVMYALGQGTTVDLPRAMAWMTLAAERKDPKYLHAQTLVEKSLKPDDAVKASAILNELEARYGDKSALRRAKNRWAQVKSGETGSLTGHTIGPMSVGPLGGAREDASIVYRDLEKSDDNPYDKPTVTVGALAPAPSNNASPSKKTDSSNPPDSNHPLP